MTLVTAWLRMGAQNTCLEAGTSGQGTPSPKPETFSIHRRTQASEGRLARLCGFKQLLVRRSRHDSPARTLPPPPTAGSLRPGNLWPEQLTRPPQLPRTLGELWASRSASGPSRKHPCCPEPDAGAQRTARGPVPRRPGDRTLNQNPAEWGRAGGRGRLPGRPRCGSWSHCTYLHADLSHHAESFVEATLPHLKGGGAGKGGDA